MTHSIRRLLALIAFVVPLAASVSSLALTQFTYPPPGSPTAVLSGQPGDVGGSDWDFSAWNTAEYQDLYVGAGYHGAGLDGTAYDLTFAGISGQTVTYTGTTPWTSPGGDVAAGNYVIPVTVSVTLTGYGATPWELSSLSGADLLDGTIGAVANISAGLDFTLHWEVIADLSAEGGGAAVALNDVQQGGGGLTQSSVGTAWFGVVPEPGTALLFGLGLAGLSVRGRRRS